MNAQQKLEAIKQAIANGSESDAMAVIEADAKNAARYLWLRAGNAYFPEEAMIRGGDSLDIAIDAEILHAEKVLNGSPDEPVAALT